MHFLLFLLFIGTYGYRPNVLLIVLDDLKPALGCYNDFQAHTPHIDALASRSFIFTKAYAQQALCAPSRNSFLTSRRPDTLHLYDFYSYWRKSVGNFTTLPQHFKLHGYHTHSIGKIFHPGISSNFSDDQPYSWSQKPFHPKTLEYKNARVCTNPDGTLGKNLICPVVPEFQPMGTLPDIESMQEAVEFLKTHHHANMPYFLALGFHKPHIPFKFPQRYLDLHPMGNISLPTNPYRPSSLPDVAWNPWTDIRQRDDIKNLHIQFPYGPIPNETIKQIIQAYYASVSYVDDLIGKVLKEVDFRDTVVILTGDHGWSLGQHGEFSKFSNFEEATRVPLIIHVPYLNDRKIIINSLVELVDLFPTLVDLTQVSGPLQPCPANKPINLCTEGLSLLPVMIEAKQGRIIKGKSAIFTQYPRPGAHPSLNPNSDKPHLKDIKIMGYSIKTQRYRYCQWVQFNHGNFTIDWDKVYGTEMYDHLLDPEENLNLAGRNGLEYIEEELRRLLIAGWRDV